MPQHRPTHARPKAPTRPRRAASNRELLLTRRHFLFGALGAGALALAAGGGIAVSQGIKAQEERSAVDVLEVPEAAVSVSDTFTELAFEDCVGLVGSFDLPFGTLVWTSNDAVAACLVPNEQSATPLASVAVLLLGTGEYPVVLSQAVGQDQGFDIYDVRMSEQGIVWTEASILDGIWRIYAAPFSGGALGEPFLADEGDSEWEVPTIAAVGASAFWQVLPALGGSHTQSESLLKRVRFGATTDPDTLYSSMGRMCTPPYPLSKGLVITPRTDTEGINHQLTLIDADSGEVRDKLVLPQSMKPLEAGYGPNGFTFSFEGDYQYGGGIARLGTYTPAETHDPENYADLAWFRFAKYPTAPPAWCGSSFIVKSTYSVCGVNLSDQTYFPLDVLSGCDSYGDYLATTGETSTFVTSTNISDTDIDGGKKKLCRIRVWKPLA